MSRFTRRLPIGADIQPDGQTHFRVWAPDPREVVLVVEECSKHRQDIPMTPERDGYYSALVPGVGHGDRYWFRLDGELSPDPASRFQPEGPFGPSQVVDPDRFDWHDQSWRGVAADRRVVYEMHVGTFTPDGVWPAAAEKLPRLPTWASP
jgi:maltooligosyltrehalose trehalohydrolase